MPASIDFVQELLSGGSLDKNKVITDLSADDVPVLGNLVWGNDSTLARRAIAALGLFPGPASLEILRQVLNSSDLVLRAAAANALANFKEVPGSAQLLIKALSDEAPAVKKFALYAIENGGYRSLADTVADFSAQSTSPFLKETSGKIADKFRNIPRRFFTFKIQIMPFATNALPIPREVADAEITKYQELFAPARNIIKGISLITPTGESFRNFFSEEHNAFIFSKDDVFRFFSGPETAEYLMVIFGAHHEESTSKIGSPTVIIAGVKQVEAGGADEDGVPFRTLNIPYPATEYPPKYATPVLPGGAATNALFFKLRK